MIIGLTGKNASGKGEVAKYLQKKGFIYFSLSDIVRDEATKRGLSHSRANLISIGNELRKKFGPCYLAKQINKKIQNSEKLSSKENFFVIDSVRNPKEAEELMKNRGFVLIGVDAPIELRFQRLLKRSRFGDARTLDEFKYQEQKENLNNIANQQLDATIKFAEKLIVNDDSLEVLHKKIDSVLNDLI